MSKRYGRNQKRAHREKIAAMENLVNLMDAEQNRVVNERNRWAREYRDLRHSVDNWDGRIADILGVYSMLRFKPQLMDLGPRVREFEYLEVQERKSLATDLNVPYRDTSRLERLENFVVFLEEREDLGELSRLISLVQSNGEVMAYSLSKRDFDNLGVRDERFLQWLSGRIATLLTKHVNGCHERKHKPMTAAPDKGYERI